MLNNKYSGWHSIYTDGSQTKDGSGAAYYVPSQNIRESFNIVNEQHTNCIVYRGVARSDFRTLRLHTF